MSNRSRGRLAATPTQPEPEIDKTLMDRLDDAMETPGKAGLRKLVGLVLEGRNKPEPEREPAPHSVDVTKAPPREPTAYEHAILNGLRDKPVYQGTVEPDRVAARRLKAKRGRRADRRRRLADAHAVLWLIGASIAFTAALFYAPPADAITSGVNVQTTIVWSGGSDCNNAGRWADPVNPRQIGVFVTTECSDVAQNTRVVHEGEWVGADPDIGDALAVSCRVVIVSTGELLRSDRGYAGDGHDITCLGRWT